MSENSTKELGQVIQPLSVFLCAPSWFSLGKPCEKPQFFGLQSLQVSHRL